MGLRSLLIILLSFAWTLESYAQVSQARKFSWRNVSIEYDADRLPYLPVKLKGKWGFQDTSKGWVIPPLYDWVSDFRNNSFALGSKDGVQGIVTSDADFTAIGIGDGIEYIGEDFVGIYTNGWLKVHHITEGIVYDSVLSKAELYLGNSIKIVGKSGTGVISKDGLILVPPRFESVSWVFGGFFVGHIGKESNLFYQGSDGLRVGKVEPVDSFNCLVRIGDSWSLVDTNLIRLNDIRSPRFNSSENFVYLPGGNDGLLYSKSRRKVSVTAPNLSLIELSPQLLAFNERNRLGILSDTGSVVQTARFDRVNSNLGGGFNVVENGLEGLIGSMGEMLLEPQFDRIDPFVEPVARTVSNERFGLVDFRGQILAEAEFEAVNVSPRKVKLVEGKQTQFWTFDESGEIDSRDTMGNHKTLKFNITRASNFRIGIAGFAPDIGRDTFVWFRDPETNLYGLHNRLTNTELLEPKYIWVKKVGERSIAALPKSSRSIVLGSYVFNTPFLLGLVDHRTGEELSPFVFKSFEEGDIERGKLCRAILSNGKHCLLDLNGKVVVKGANYIGPWQGDYRRVNLKGTIMQGTEGPYEDEITPLRGLFPQASQIDGMELVLANSFMQDRGWITRCVGGKWGVLDSLGNFALDPNWSMISTISQSSSDGTKPLVVAREDKNWGLLQLGGDSGYREVIPLKYKAIGDLPSTNEDLWWAQDLKTTKGLLSPKGNVVLEVKYKEVGQMADFIPVRYEDGKYGLVDRDGRVVIPGIGSRHRGMSDGTFALRVKRKWTYFDSTGQELLSDDSWVDVMPFSEGLAAVKLRGRWGFIDKTGEQVIEPEFVKVNSFKNGRALVMTKKGWFWIDKKGKPTRTGKYKRILDIHASKDLQVVMRGSNYGIANGNQKVSGSFKATKIYESSGGWNLFKHKGKGKGFGYYTQDGKVAPVGLHKRAKDRKGAWMPVASGRGYKMIDTTGKVVVGKMERLLGYGADWICYKEAGIYYVLNSFGSKVFSSPTIRPLDIVHGTMICKNRAGKYVLLDRQGRIKIPGQFHKVEVKGDLLYAQDLTGLWGVMNHSGIWIIPPKYSEITNAGHGHFHVSQALKMGIYKRDGSIVIQPEFEFVEWVGFGLFRVYSQDKIGYMNPDGSWFIEPRN